MVGRPGVVKVLVHLVFEIERCELLAHLLVVEHVLRSAHCSLVLGPRLLLLQELVDVNLASERALFHLQLLMPTSGDLLRGLRVIKVFPQHGLDELFVLHLELIVRDLLRHCAV